MPRRKSAQKLEDLCVDRIASRLNSVNSTLNSLPSSRNKGNNPFHNISSSLLKEIYNKLCSLTNIIHVEILKTLVNGRMIAVDLKSIEIDDSDFEEVLKSIIEIAPTLSELILPFRLDNEFSCQLMFDLGAKLCRVTHLDLGFLYIKNFLDVIGKNCKLLISLNMYSNLITDEDLESLCFNTKEPADNELRCQNLEIIDLETDENADLEHNITTEGIKTLLKYLPKLSSLGWFDVAKVLLDLHKNDYSSTETVYSLKEIYYSHIENDNLLCDIITKTCPFLTSLHLEDLDDTALVKFQKLEHLKTLHIDFIYSRSNDDYPLVKPFSFDRGVLPLLKSVGKSLESLNLMVKEINLVAIGQCCPQLTEIHFTTESIVQDSNEMLVLPTFSKLKNVAINLLSRTNMSLNSFLTLFGNCSNLNGLSLIGIKNFNLFILKEILKRNPLSKLESLHLVVEDVDRDFLEFITSDEILFYLRNICIFYPESQKDLGNFLYRLEHRIRCKNLDLDLDVYNCGHFIL